MNIVPQYDEATGRPTGQIALQLLPVYFREFQGEKKDPAVFTYQKAQITTVEFDGGFDFRLYGQYEHIFNPPVAQAQAPSQKTETAPVIKLFDE